MNHKVITLLIVLFSCHAHAWTIDSNFNSGSIGTKADGADGFTGAFKNSLYSDKFVNSGKGSAQLTITEGSKGFGEFGGEYKFPKVLREGDEVWIRVWAYFPTGFSFSCGGCSQGVKYIRIHTASESGSNEGYHSILLKDSAVEVDSEVTGKTFHSNNVGKKTVGEKNTTGTWHAYEMYIRFSATPGKGVYRVWQNGNLVFEDTTTNTLKSSTSKADLIYLFSYWNNGAPKTQSAFVDEIIVTSVKPSETDSEGNPFIGVGNFKPIAPPSPPSLQ
jgi:hypothetical protein